MTGTPVTGTPWTPGPLTVKGPCAADNTGGHDYAVVDDAGNVVAECFEHVGPDGARYERRPARANAILYASAPELVDALESFLFPLDLTEFQSKRRVARDLLARIREGAS